MPQIHNFQRVKRARNAIFNPYSVMGERIKLCRKALSVSTQKLAEALEIPEILLTKIEGGQIKLTYNFLCNVAEFLGTTPIYLLTGVDEKRIRASCDYTAKLTTFIGFISRLPAKKKMAIRDFINFFDQR